MDLADALSEKMSMRTVRTFHTVNEPSKSPGVDGFLGLTPAFEVVDDSQRMHVRITDDITIVQDLTPSPKRHREWYRILTDDMRILNALNICCHANHSAESNLKKASEVFGGHVEIGLKYNISRLTAPNGGTVALTSPVVGQRERVAEIVSPPLSLTDINLWASSCLQVAKDFGCTIPHEGATHLHIDADVLKSTKAFGHLLRYLLPRQMQFRQWCRSNPACCKLALAAPEIMTLVNAKDFSHMAWDQVRDRLSKMKLSKFSDLNLKYLGEKNPHLNTVEWRTFPSTLNPEDINRWTHMICSLVDLSLSESLSDDMTFDDIYLHKLSDRQG